MGYDPELDVIPELLPDAASYFQSIFDIISWLTELGWIDIITKVLLLSFHLSLPQDGHLDVAV